MSCSTLECQAAVCSTLARSSLIHTFSTYLLSSACVIRILGLRLHHCRITSGASTDVAVIQPNRLAPPMPQILRADYLLLLCFCRDNVRSPSTVTTVASPSLHLGRHPCHLRNLVTKLEAAILLTFESVAQLPHIWISNVMNLRKRRIPPKRAWNTSPFSSSRDKPLTLTLSLAKNRKKHVHVQFLSKTCMATLPCAPLTCRILFLAGALQLQALMRCQRPSSI